MSVASAPASASTAAPLGPSDAINPAVGAGPRSYRRCDTPECKPVCCVVDLSGASELSLICCLVWGSTVLWCLLQVVLLETTLQLCLKRLCFFSVDSAVTRIRFVDVCYGLNCCIEDWKPQVVRLLTSLFSSLVGNKRRGQVSGRCNAPKTWQQSGLDGSRSTPLSTAATRRFDRRSSESYAPRLREHVRTFLQCGCL